MRLIHLLVGLAAAITCDDVLSSNANLCYSAYKLDNRTYTACTSGCGVSECCSDPKTCYDAYYNLPYDLYGLCYSQYQEVNISLPCNGATCNSTACCSLPSTCYDLSYINSAYSNCPANYQFDYNLVCPPAGCTLSNCCRLPNCGDYLDYNYYTCQNQNLAPGSRSKTCSGSCDNSQCCRPLVQCNETTNVAYQCSSNNQVLGPEIACTTCDAAHCCRAPLTCGEISQSNSYWCGMSGKVFAYESPTFYNNCGGACTTSQCCRAPMTCGEFIQVNYSAYYQCDSSYTLFNSSAPCSGSSCWQPATCCTQPRSCSDLYSVQSGNFCYSMQKAWNNSDYSFYYSDCGGTCTAQRCCRPFTSCGDAFAANSNFFSQYCYPNGLVTASNYQSCTTCTTECCAPPTTCSGLFTLNYNLCSNLGLSMTGNYSLLYGSCEGPCNSQTCCVAAQDCQAANYIANNNISNQCYSNGLYMNGSIPCNPSCTAANCCQQPQQCYQIPNSYNYCPSNLYFDSSAGCAGGSCTQSDCCRQPRTCAEMGYQFCQNAQLFDNSSDYFFYSATCDILPCTTSRCCRPARTCGESQYYSNTGLQSQCTQMQMVFNSSAPCSGSSCDTTTCCSPPSTCSDYNSINNYQLQYQWCGTTSYFDYSVFCGSSCSAATCCRPFMSCYEAQQTNNGFCTGGSVFDTTSPYYYTTCNGTCTQATCCRQPQYCQEITSPCGANQVIDAGTFCGSNCNSVTCCRNYQNCNEANNVGGYALQTACFSLGKVLDWQKNCTGTNCNSQTCCKLPTYCYEQQNLDYQFCPRVSMSWNSGATCGVGGCTTQQCCVPPSSCSEANGILSDKLCYDRGTVSSMSCSGVGCNASVCCNSPMTCNDVQQATNEQYYMSSIWCARKGFTDQFNNGNCNGECTAATCCGTVSTCNDWQSVWDKTRVRNNGPDNICPNGNVFDGTLSCGGGPCNDKTCCRPPSKCSEAGFQYLCPVNTYMVDNSCSGATCSQATCCMTPTTCSQANMNFFLCANAQMVINLNATGSCNGACTASKCCSPANSCGQLPLLQCPANSRTAYNLPCGGTNPACDANRCCVAYSTCTDALQDNETLCAGYGFFNWQASFTSCGSGGCTQSKCCRNTAATCGEADILTGFCGGAVDFFKPCSGASCNTVNCCRAASNCAEAVKSGSVVCGSGSIPDHQDMAACPSGGCSISTCCKAVATCGDANVAANGQLCSGATSFLQASLSCGGGTPCNAATCCRAPANCGEATQTSFCSGATPLVNLGAASSACNPTCTQAQCCRGPTSCVEAYLNDVNFCGALDFNLNAATSACTNCIATCCIAPVTFAPSSAPTAVGTPTAAPNNGAPTPSCPRSAFATFLSSCVNLDFKPVVSCSTKCRQAADALLKAFVGLFNANTAAACLDQNATAATIFTADIHTYIVGKLQTNITMCGPSGGSTAPTVVSGAEVVGFSVALLGGLLMFFSL